RAGSERSVRPHDLTPSQDASSDRAAFERFAQSYAQPYRRAVAAVTRANAATSAGSPVPADARDSVGSQRDAAEEIGWWLLHRWIGRQPAAYRPESLIDLLTPVAASPAFAAERVSELLWALRADPGFLGRTDRTGALGAVGADGVRERFVGYL